MKKSNLSPKTQARSCCLNCEKPKPEHFSSFFCAWARRQARAISSFCPRKNIREASKISLQSFWQRSKEKKIVDANRSNSQVKSCFLQKQIISYLVQWPLKQPQEVIEFVKIKSQDLVVIHIHSDLVGISFGFLYIFAVCLKKDEFTRPFAEKRCTLHSMN